MKRLDGEGKLMSTLNHQATTSKTLHNYNPSHVARYFELLGRIIIKLKADRPHPRNYPHTATDYRHTDKHLRLVMVVGQTVQPWERTRTDGQTDGRTDGQTDRRTDATKYIISLASRSIKMPWGGLKIVSMWGGLKSRCQKPPTSFSNGKALQVHFVKILFWNRFKTLILFSQRKKIPVKFKIPLRNYNYIAIIQQHLILLRYSCCHCHRIEFVESSTKSISWRWQQEYHNNMRCCWNAGT